MKNSPKFLLLMTFLTFSIGLMGVTAPVTVNAYDSDGNPIAANYQVFKGPNYVGQYATGTPVDLVVGDSYKLFAHYLNTSTERVEFTVDGAGNTFNFSTTKVTFHWSGGYLEYRGSGSWKSFGQTDGKWNTIEIFPKDFSGNTMQFHFGYKWNDVRGVTVEMDFSGKKTIEKVVSQLRILDHNGAPLAGGKARGGYATPSVWFVPGVTNDQGLLMDFRDGSNENLSYEMNFNNTASVSAQQESSIYEFQTELLTLRLETCSGDPLDGGSAAYGMGNNAGVWFFPGGNTGSSVAGETAAELFPSTLSFRMQYQGTTEYKYAFNFPSDGNLLTWKTTNVMLNYEGAISFGGATGDSRWFNKPAMELLPGTYTFHFRNAETTDLTIEGCSMIKAATLIKLVDSKDNGLEGGVGTYYNSGWKSAGTTNADGNIFLLIDGKATKYSFKMAWAGYSQQLSNVDIMTTNPVLFKTIPVVARLENSTSAGLEDGQAIYYASGWKTLGTTGADGNTDPMELLPGKYSFQMKYLGYSQQISNVSIETTNPVVFATTPMVVELHNSTDALMDEGDVIYYASGWKTFGTTSGGTVSKELLPGKYSFQMKYQGYSQQQSNIDITTVNPLIFKTVNVTMKLLASDGSTELEGIGKYYASGWKNFGTTPTTATMELLPGKYPFNVNYGGATKQISQDISVDPLVVFNTIPVTMKLIASDGTTELEGMGKYYASGWKEFGTTPTTAAMDLLPAKYPFSVSYGGATLQMSQDVSLDPVVEFNTVLVTMKLLDGDGVELEGAGKYYASGWKDFGTTPTTETMEMLPVNYPFSVSYAGSSLQKSQNVSVDPVVIFTGTSVTLHFGGDISYYASGWKTFNKPTMSLLPGKYPIRFSLPGQPAYQTTLIVEGSTMEKTVAYIRLIDSKGKGLEGGEVVYYLSGWKPVGLTNSSGIALAIIDGSYTKFTTQMNWAGYTQQQSNVSITTDAVIYQTIPVFARLEDSGGTGIIDGEAVYYAAGWKTLGTTMADGNTPKLELLPGKYSFQMKYEGYSPQQSNIDVSVTNPVVFATIPMVVELRNSLGDLMDEGIVSFYASGWRTFGTTSGGTVTKELLPGTYSFTMKYANYSVQKSSINITSVNPLVFNTINATMKLLDNSNTELAGTATYYGNGWYTFGSGTTTTSMEMLPASYVFNIKYSGKTLQKSQNISIDPDVVFTWDGASLKNASMKVLGDMSSNSYSTSLNGVYPNPFISLTTIEFSIEKMQRVTIAVYDVKGVLVKTLLSSELPEGAHSVNWNSTNDLGGQIQPGIYIIRLQTADYVGNKMVIKN